jgi:ABC-type multidrug transport system fused ATPase/permease subunit
MRNIWRAVRFIPKYRRRLVGVIAVGALISLVGTTTPYVYKAIVDVITSLVAGGSSRSMAATRVLSLITLFFGLRIAMIFATALQQRQADSLWLETVSAFRQRVFDNITRLSIDYFEKTHAGEIMDRFGAINTVAMWLGSLTEGTLASVLSILFFIAALLARSIAVGLIMVVVVLLNLSISLLSARWSKPRRRGWQRQAGRMAGLMAELISNISTVRSFGAEWAVKERYDATEAEWRVDRGKSLRIQWWSGLALNAVNALGVFVAVALTARSALQGNMTAGDILLVLTLSQNLIASTGPIARQINQIAEIDTAAERLVELLDAETELDDREGALELDELRSIEFEHVTFSYPGKTTPVLCDISFSIRAGETLALVGPSGSGKTTVVKLLMRFYDPSAGRVLVNGRDLRGYQIHSVRAKMGVVLQDVALFNDTVSANIALARSGASFDDVQAAARAAHAEEFIERLSNRYDALVGERGAKLSVGEKQRVAIARAILKDPQLIILDEATSALDSESERMVQKGLARLLERRSSIIIAHRLSTVISANQIVVLEHGRIVEHGSHSTLSVRPGGLYARLCALQSNGRFAELSL